MVVRKVWANKATKQLLVTIPNYLKIKEGDTVKIIKTDKKISTKIELIKTTIMDAMNNDGIEKFMISNMFKQMTTKRVVFTAIRELLKEGKIKKEKNDDCIFYSLSTPVTLQ